MELRRFLFDSYVTPADAYHVARKKLDAKWPSFVHNHDYYELFMVERGKAHHNINDQTQTLSRGALYFIRPNDAHRFCADETEGCDLINIMFRPETGGHLFARYGDDIGRRFFWSEDAMPDNYVLTGPRFERAINTMAELQAAPRVKVQIEQFLLSIMTRVVDYAFTLPEGTPRWLASACITARNPDVFRQGSAGFVEVTGRGHEHVCRMTRKHLGMSPTQYINRIRMEHAAMQLGSSDMQILDISLDCGIENLSHFYKLFREVYGNTPNEYRRNHRFDPVQP